MADDQGSGDVSEKAVGEIDGDLYRKVLGRYPTGVTLVTAMDGEDPLAMVIGSFVSVSMDPPLVGFLPAKESYTWGRMSSSGGFCVNVLSDNQADYQTHFFAKTATLGRDPAGSPLRSPDRRPSHRAWRPSTALCTRWLTPVTTGS